MLDPGRDERLAIAAEKKGVSDRPTRPLADCVDRDLQRRADLARRVGGHCDGLKQFEIALESLPNGRGDDVLTHGATSRLNATLFKVNLVLSSSMRCSS